MKFAIREDVNYAFLSIAALGLGFVFYFIGFSPLTLLCFIGAGMLYYLHQMKEREKILAEQQKKITG